MKSNNLCPKSFTPTLLLIASIFCSSHSVSDASFAAAIDNPGVVAFNEGRYHDAEAYFLTQLKSPAGKNNSLIYLSKIAMETGAAQAAADNIKEALNLEPTDAEEIILSGDIYCNQAQHSSIFSAINLAKKCIAQYEAAIELAPENSNALVSAVRFYLEAPGIAGGSNKRGKELLTRLGVVSPEDADTYQIFLLDNNGEPDAAMKLADELSKKVLQSARNQYELARFYRDKTLYDKAKPLFESLLSRSETPENKWYVTDSLLQLGEIFLIENQNINKSIELMEQYKKKNSNPHDKHYLWSTWSLAQAYKINGDKDKYDLLVSQIQAEDYEKNAPFAKRFKAGIKAN